MSDAKIISSFIGLCERTVLNYPAPNYFLQLFCRPEIARRLDHPFLALMPLTEKGFFFLFFSLAKTVFCLISLKTRVAKTLSNSAMRM